MSRAYRIRISETLTRTVHVRDGLGFQLEVLEVLPRARMAALVRAALQARGFVEAEDGGLLREQEGVVVRVEPETGAVVVSLASEEEVQKEVSSLVPRADAAAAAALRAKLERALEAEQEKRRERLSARLEAQLPAIRKELDAVATRAVAEGLKEKAQTLGEIEELSEDPETGALLIRVRL